MRIMVTGGAGFIGSHLCTKLLQQGNEVVCLDRYFNPQDRVMARLRTYSNFVAIEHDVIDPIFLDVDQIYHLACPASPVQYQSDPVHTFKTAVYGTCNILELARKLGVPMLQASTSEIYGDPQEHPQTESYRGSVNPVGIRSCYNEGKRGAESLCMDFHRCHGVDVRIVRIFNCYGPHMKVDDGRVISNFIVSALRQEDMTIYGTGMQTRSFQYVQDLVEAMCKLMSLPHPCTGPINIGNPQEISILELGRMVKSLCRSKSRIVFKSAVSDDPHRRKPDISLAQDLLNWNPQVQIEEGLRRTIAYFQSTCKIIEELPVA